MTDEQTPRCHFCDKTPKDVPAVVTPFVKRASLKAICTDCISLCLGVLSHAPNAVHTAPSEEAQMDRLFGSPCGHCGQASCDCSSERLP